MYNIVLPAQLPGVWRQLPAPLELGLWLPHLSSAAGGAILATFYSEFPQRVPRWKTVLGVIFVREHWAWSVVRQGLARLEKDAGHAGRGATHAEYRDLLHGRGVGRGTRPPWWRLDERIIAAN